jgi:hypothetical protein
MCAARNECVQEAKRMVQKNQPFNYRFRVDKDAVDAAAYVPLLIIAMWLCSKRRSGSCLERPPH